MAMSRGPGESGVRRRELIATIGTGAVLLAGGSWRAMPALADLPQTKALMDQIIGARTAEQGRVSLDLPEIAENGNTVPLTVEVDSPMTEGDYVKAVHIFAEGNPQPEVAKFHFTPHSGHAKASTRIRLAGTQTVHAIAEMSDGSVFTAAREVKVTIGGCGG